MRLPIFGHPRVISCADETKAYLCLPRGCKSDLVSIFEKHGIEILLSIKPITAEGLMFHSLAGLEMNNPWPSITSCKMTPASFQALPHLEKQLWRSS
jgi:hypothetical protein